MQQVTVSRDKLIQYVDWVLFIGLVVVAAWFSYGVLDNYWSEKSGFTQSEVANYDRPTISIVPTTRFISSTWHQSAYIQYCAIYALQNYCINVKDGENDIRIPFLNKTESVFLDRREGFPGIR